MNNKGFTLIELLAVVCLLLIISTVSFPAVNSMLSKDKDKISEDLKKSFENITQTYVENNTLTSGSIEKLNEGKKLKMPIAYLVRKELIDYPIIDPKTDIEIDSKSSFVVITKEADNYKYEYSTECNECEEIEFSGEYTHDLGYGDTVNENLNKDFIPITSKDSSNANVPVLAPGMIPVVYDEDKNCWIVTTYSRWYNYDESKWANAVTVHKDNYSDLFDETGTLKIGQIVDNVASMWVWIPKYEYRINKYYYFGGTEGNIGTVDIRFIKKDQNTPTTNSYRISKAFTFGSSNLSGFWVRKENLEGVTYVLETMDKYYHGISNIMISNNNEYLSNVDTHTIKNSEWSTMTYLAHSKYGFKKNKNNIMVDSNNSTTGNEYGIKIDGTGTFVMTKKSSFNFETIGVDKKYFDLYDDSNAYEIYELNDAKITTNFVYDKNYLIIRGENYNLFNIKTVSGNDATNPYNLRVVLVNTD